MKSKERNNDQIEDVDILIISTYDTDGAGKFAIQIADYASEIGYSTRIVCLNKKSSREVSKGVFEGKLILRAVNRIKEELERRAFRAKPEYAFIHLSGVPDCVILGSKAFPKSCKMIILVFSSGMLSSTALLKLWRSYGKPRLIFYGVDMNFFTGGCHYSSGCKNYQMECRACPAVPKILHQKVLDDQGKKQASYLKIHNHMVIASSTQQEKQIAASKIFRKSNIKKVLMAVNERKYGAYEKSREVLRREYGLSGIVIIIRSSYEYRKGCEYFTGALKEMLAEKPEICELLTVLTVGDDFIKSQVDPEKINLIHHGYVEDENVLSKLYSASDVFVMSSVDDSGPVMLVQSLMSGTPVIATDVGLARDLIAPPLNGYIVPPASAEAIKNRLTDFFMLSPQKRQRMRVAARESALSKASEARYKESLAQILRN